MALKGVPRWTDEDKLKMSIYRSKKRHPRWTPISMENQEFIRLNFPKESANWIRVHMPQPISQKKLKLCLDNLKENPQMHEITDFL